jgi:hypothetical protein
LALVRRMLMVACALAAAGAGLAACDQATVTIAFHPPVGACYRYQVTVHTVTVTHIGDRAPDRQIDDAVIESEDTVLSSGPAEARVRVRLRREGDVDRTFVVRLDRAAQLAGVETVEGLPSSVLGPTALPEILPGAPAAPPDRPLAPGDRWTIDVPADAAGGQPGGLQGVGRLVDLRLVNGRKVASTSAVTRIPVSDSDRGVMRTGVATTQSTALRDLADGAVERTSSQTHGDFDLVVSPPPGREGTALPGSQTLDANAETRRRASCG